MAIWRAGQCRRCGGDLAETTDPKHDSGNPHGTHLYRRTALKRCHRCTALMESEAAHSAPKPGHIAPPHPGAVQHFVELVPRGTPMPGQVRRKPRKKPPKG